MAGRYLENELHNKALLTFNLGFFSRPVDGVTVKCNHKIMEKKDKKCIRSVVLFRCF